ncbi:MAG: hypothetical protein R3C11_21310 [Planctomycetaceae bacterium]
MALTENVEEPVTAQPVPDLNKMTITEYARYLQEQNPEGVNQGVLTADNLPLATPNDSFYEDDMAPDPEAFAAALLFFGSISFCCYLVAVWDGREPRTTTWSASGAIADFSALLGT